MSESGLPETFNTRHTVTGQIQRLTADQIEVFKDYLEIVPEGTKPLQEGLFKPGKVGEFEAPEEEPPAPVVDAQTQYDLLIEEGHSPNSKVVREAKAALDAAEEEAEAEREAAAALTASIQNGESVSDALSSEGGQD